MQTEQLVGTTSSTRTKSTSRLRSRRDIAVVCGRSWQSSKETVIISIYTPITMTNLLIFPAPRTARTTTRSCSYSRSGTRSPSPTRTHCLSSPPRTPTSGSHPSQSPARSPSGGWCSRRTNPTPPRRPSRVGHRCPPWPSWR